MVLDRRWFLGLVLAAGCGAPGAPISPGAVPDGKADADKAKLVTYPAFVQALFGVDGSKVVQFRWFEGKSGANPCVVSAGGQKGVVGFLASVGGVDDDSLAGVQVLQSNDKVSKKKSGQTVTYNFVDTVCQGQDTVVAGFSSSKEDIDDLVSIDTTVRENGCGAQDMFTSHQRACDGLQLRYEDSTVNQAAAAKLMKSISSLPSRITTSRFQGCFLDVTRLGQLFCTWDISDDVEGDTGNIEEGAFELKDHAPAKAVSSRLIDKFTGEPR
jgi:hypothetical protein